MQTNPYNILITFIKLLQRNNEAINKIIQKYETGKSLTYFESMQESISLTEYPCLEIEPNGCNTDWYSCRSQRATYNFEITLTFKIVNSRSSNKYPNEVFSTIAQIINNPANLQLRVENEQKFSPSIGLVDTYIQDSLINNATNGKNFSGNTRVIQFDWFATIHEPFPDSAWKYGNIDQPTDLKNRIII